MFSSDSQDQETTLLMSGMLIRFDNNSSIFIPFSFSRFFSVMLRLDMICLCPSL